jgi:hypothetical protein
VAKAKNWVVNSFPDSHSCILNIDGVGEFQLAALTIRRALNQIPRATCLVATGRDARSPTVSATIHTAGPSLLQMRKATITLKPEGEWIPGGDEWNGEQVIFDGYYVGPGHQMVLGKIQPVLYLVDWLIDLVDSSTLSARQHPQNPGSLVMPAVSPSGSGVVGPPIYVSTHFEHAAIRSKVKSDLWTGIKTMLCSLAQEDRFNLACGNGGLGAGDKRSNARALNALSRIEGPADACKLDYKFGKPLSLRTEDVPNVEDAVAESIVHHTFESFAQLDFWSAIVGVYCPMFNLALVPLTDRALIVADTPGLRGEVHRIIAPDEYGSLQAMTSLTRPLRGVGVYGDYESLTKWEVTEPGRPGSICVGGEFVVDSVDTADGAYLVVRSPPWLRMVTLSAILAGQTSGVTKNQPTTTETDEPARAELPDDPAEAEIPTATPGEILPKIRSLYDRFAQSVYVANMLRNRTAQLSGKLRFDISPGSLVQIESKPEQFLQGLDSLAVPLVAQVMEVNIHISSEASLCGTTLTLTHLRTIQENLEDRTSVSEHPLFGPDVFRGAPLIEDWEFPALAEIPS